MFNSCRHNFVFLLASTVLAGHAAAAGTEWFDWFLPRGLRSSDELQPRFLNPFSYETRYLRSHGAYRNWLHVRYGRHSMQFSQMNYGLELARPLTPDGRWGHVTLQWSGFDGNTTGRFTSGNSVIYHNDYDELACRYAVRTFEWMESCVGYSISKGWKTRYTGFSTQLGFDRGRLRGGIFFSRHTFQDAAVIWYDVNRIGAPLAYHVDNRGFYMSVTPATGLQGGVVATYGRVGSDLVYEDSYSSIPDGASRRYEGTLTGVYGPWRLRYDVDVLSFDGLSRFEQDNQQYGKINIPNPKYVAHDGLVAYRFGTRYSTFAEFNHIGLTSHVGAIVESWPFTGALVDLLGTSYEAGVDGRLTWDGLFAGGQWQAGQRHGLQLKTGWVFLRGRGHYEFRKVQGIFFVVDRGSGSWRVERHLLDVAVDYHLQFPSWIVDVSGEQLLPLPSADRSSRNLRKVKASGGGFLGKVALTWLF